MEDRRPVEVFPPGDFIKDELEERGWTQSDLADIIGRSVALVSDIIAKKRGITPETAKVLGEAFGTSAQFWLNLESMYQLSLVSNEDNHVARRARLYTRAPIKDMIKRGWLEPSTNIEVVEKRLLDFFEIRSLDKDAQFWAYAARKSTSYRAITPAQNAWLFRAKRIAKAVPVKNFSQAAFKEAIERLRPLLYDVEEIRHVPRILADAGIRFLVVEPLPHTRIDGGCFWLDGSPVVVVSLRFDRVDCFWHTVFHELGHAKNRDGIKNASLDVDLTDGGETPVDQKPEYEQEADRFAVETLVPQKKLNDFIAGVHPLYSRLKIMGFAKENHVHPGIVVGQLQYSKKITYASHRDMLVKVRSIVTQSALTDGWGCSLPVAL